jgi:hypothetical protein
MCTTITLYLDQHEASKTRVTKYLVVFNEVRPIDPRLMSENEHQIKEANVRRDGKGARLIESNVGWSITAED